MRGKSAIAAVCLLVIAASVWHMLSPPKQTWLPEDQDWYFDLVERRPFAAAALQIPPITSPWGNPSAKVFYFSCGSCSEEERFPGFFLMFSEEAKRHLDAHPDEWGAALGESYPGRLYSSDATNWVAASSVEKSGVTRELAQRCPGKLRFCR